MQGVEISVTLLIILYVAIRTEDSLRVTPLPKKKLIMRYLQRFIFFVIVMVLMALGRPSALHGQGEDVNTPAGTAMSAGEVP